MAEVTKTSTLYSSSNTYGYYYKVRSYCDLWRYHEFLFMEENGHPYNDKLPEIIEVQNTQEDLERYYEILFNVLNVEVNIRDKYNVVSIVRRVRGTAPNLGIEVLELTDFYKCGDLTKGLFIHKVNFNSAAYLAYLEEGDVIVKMKRPEVERTPPHLWDSPTVTVTAHEDGSTEIQEVLKTFKTYPIESIKDLMDFFVNVRNKELIIFTVIRDGVEMDIPMKAPIESKMMMKVDLPRIVVKTIPVFEIKNGYLRMNCVDVNNASNQVAADNMNQLFGRIKGYVEERDLVFELPNTLNDVEFYINENGELAARYD